MKDCEVCSEDSRPAPYKCPTCRIPYCSVQCWKTHKSQICVPSKTSVKQHETSENKPIDYQYPTEDTVPPEKLNLLRESKELREILANPYVRDILTAIDRSKNPSESIKTAMQEPIFVEFADACLKIVQPEDELEIP